MMTPKTIFLCLLFLLLKEFSFGKAVLPEGAHGAQIIRWVLQLPKSDYEDAVLNLKSLLPEASREDLPYYYKGLGLLAARSKKSDLAIYYYKKALEACEAVPAVKDDLYSNLHRNLGNQYKGKGRQYLWDSSRYHLTTALEYELKLDTYSKEYSKIMKLLGGVYDRLGDHDNAVNYYHARLEYYLQHQPDAIDNIAGSYNDLSWVYSERLRDPVQGLAYAERGLQINDLTISDRVDLRFNCGLSNEIMASDFSKQDTEQYYESAINHYQATLELCHNSLTMGHDSSYMEYIVALVHNNLGVLFNKKGDYAQALDSLRKAEAYNRADSAFYYLVQNLDNIGDALVGLNCYQEALSSYNEALSYSISGFKPRNALDLPDLSHHIAYDRLGALTTLASKAKLLATLYQETGELRYLNASIEHYNFIDQYLHKIRKSFVAEGSKFSLAQTAKPIYEGAIYSCMLMAEAEAQPEAWYKKAFYFAEQSKATILLEYMNEQVAARLALDSTSREQLFQAMQKRDWVETRLASELIDQSPDSVIQEYRQELLRYQDEVERLERQMRDQHPEFERLVARRSPLTVEQLQEEVLKNGQGVVEFFMGEEQSYAFIITPGQIRLEVLPAANSLQPVIEGILQGLKGFNTEADYALARDNYIRNAQMLYDSIIAPLGPLPSRLIIVPDDYLLYVPFEALLSRQVDTPDNFKAYPYWIKDKTISYSFSVALLEEMKNGKGREKARRFWAGFSPVFPDEHFSGQGVETLKNSHSFLEAFVGKYAWKKQLWPYEKASAGNFRAHAPDYCILHLASHTSIEEAEPLLSYIRFWEDSIFLKDLYTIPLNAELVVLHSCLTNAGRLYKGEGIASINRGVVSAGAKSVLTTLWPIRDAQSPQFMKPFYNEFLLEGMAKDESVRQAKLKMIEMGTLSPYSWAGYTLYGDTTPVVSNGNHWWWILLCTILLLLLLFYKRNRKPVK